MISRLDIGRFLMERVQTFSFLERLPDEDDEEYRLRIETRGTEMMHGVNCTWQDRILVIALQMLQSQIVLQEEPSEYKSGCYGVSYEGELASLPFSKYRFFIHGSDISEEDFDKRNTDYAAFIDAVYFKRFSEAALKAKEKEILRMLKDSEKLASLPDKFGVVCKGCSQLSLSDAAKLSLEQRRVINL
jgi:hypothetical protein